MVQTNPLETALAARTEDSRDFKKLLMDQVRAGGGTQDTKQLFQTMVKETPEVFLEVEMEEHLGYPKHDAEGRGSGNSRNGVTSKTVRGDFGQVEIKTLRDRNSSFEPKMVAKRQSSVGNFQEAVISLYARGLTTREIEQHVNDICGVEISPQFVSRATGEWQQQIVDWQNRPLERVYPIFFVDGLRVAVRTEKSVLKKCVYTVLGVGVSGKQKVLGLWIEETEGARFWLKVFNDLKARGVHDALIVCGDGRTGLPNAVESIFPQADVQLCVVHHIRNVTRFVSYKRPQALVRRHAAHLHGAHGGSRCCRPRPFRTTLGRALSDVSRQWENSLERSDNFLQLPGRIAAYDLHHQCHREPSLTDAQEYLQPQVFPHDDAVFKILFLNIRNFTNGWTKRQGWHTVMNQLMMIFGDRLKPAIDLL